MCSMMTNSYLGIGERKESSKSEQAKHWTIKRTENHEKYLYMSITFIFLTFRPIFLKYKLSQPQ